MLIRALLVGALTAMLAAVPAGSAPLPAPSFRPSPGWWTLSTGPTDGRQYAPETWAACDPGGVRIDTFDLFRGLRTLTSRGILIWAATAGRGPANRTYPSSTWPLRVSTFRVDRGWASQPAPTVQQRVRGATVRGWRLDVRVYFGTQHPSSAVLGRAQAELDRLLLPASR